MATTQQKRKVLNAVMIALAVVVVAAGIAFFISVRGGEGSSSSFLVSSKIGYANIERAGISYALDEGTALREGDALETLDGSEIGVKGPGDTALYLADASKMRVVGAASTPSKAGLELESGCVFADARSADDPLALQGAELAWTAGDAVFVSDVRPGSLTVQVLSGEVAFADGTVIQSGKSRTVLTNKSQGGAQTQDAGSKTEPAAADSKASAASTGDTTDLSLGSLDSFALEHALDALAAGRALAFSEDQINGEIKRREDERRQQAEQAAASNQASGASDGASQKQSQGAVDKSDSSSAESPSAQSANAEDEVAEAETPGADTEEEGTETEVQEVEEDESATVVEDPATSQVEGDKNGAKHTCTIQIRCDTILDNMGSLSQGKSKYVPKDGVLLASTSVSFDEGESVFDVLKRVCDENGIALEYSYTPVYGSYYVEGIGNLYEFDCGDESGWMYKVNGWFPNYGCSVYTLADGDAIMFCYTCHGLGEDVGA